MSNNSSSSSSSSTSSRSSTSTAEPCSPKKTKKNNSIGSPGKTEVKKRYKSVIKYIFYTVGFCGWIFIVIHVIGYLKRHKFISEQIYIPYEESINRAVDLVDENIYKLNESFYSSEQEHKPKRPGQTLSDLGAQVKHPVIMVPGFVTSTLEVWRGRSCANLKFRQGLWADFGMISAFLRDPNCWKDHLTLDPFNGLDPPDIRIRAAEGMKAADYFIGNYWVWSKVIENLADVGYTPSQMRMMPYDWRLAFSLLEERDGYFSELQSTVELLYRRTGEKVVLTSHSMGGLVIFYFFNYVTKDRKDGGGGGGEDWVEKHIHAFVQISTPFLGIPKAASALLSGEMSDTAAIIGALGNLVELTLGRKKRRDIWITWGSLWAMLPKGGNKLWSIGSDFCPSDRAQSNNDLFCASGNTEPSLTPMIRVLKKNEKETTTCEADHDDTMGSIIETFREKDHHYTTDIIDYLIAHGGGLGSGLASSKLHSLYGGEASNPRTWHDATREPLPKAPNMKLYCFYGFGVPTERAYYYKRNHDNVTSPINSMYLGPDPTIIIDSTVHRSDNNTKYGTRFSDGDGSVNLLSLGYLCADAWVRPETKLNPSNIPVYTREFEDHPSAFDVTRGGMSGPNASNHVDIMGNTQMIEEIVRIATDFEPPQESNIISDIKRIAKEINEHPLGGL